MLFLLSVEYTKGRRVPRRDRSIQGHTFHADGREERTWSLDLARGTEKGTQTTRRAREGSGRGDRRKRLRGAPRCQITTWGRSYRDSLWWETKGLDCKESWALKNWCFWTVVLEKTLESPLDSKEIHPVHPKGNQPWIFSGRAHAETPNTLATWCEELTHWKRPWCWARLKVGGEGDDRGWDNWMASPTP